MTGSAAERKRIRAAIVAHLQAKSSVPAARVFNSRVYHVAPAQCPAFNVFTPMANGKNETQAAHVPSFEYEVSVRVDVTVAARGDDWAAALDDLCDEVDTLVMEDVEFLAALAVSRFSWHRTTIQVSGEGEEVIATAMIDFGIVFGWDFNPTIQDALEKVRIDVDAIDPADPNTGHEDDEGGYQGGQPGPEGRIEARVDIDFGEPEPEPDADPEPEQEE